MNANGFLAQLNLDTLDTSGPVTGTFVDSSGPVILSNARWDHALKQLTFTRSLSDGENQVFVGYLFEGPSAATPPFTLAGIFTADRFESKPDFGWLAQLS
jgi:hypothetical protein